MIRASVTRAGDIVILLDTVAVDEPQRCVEHPETPAEEQAAIVGYAGKPVGHEVLKGHADLAREHQIGNLELAELKPDARIEQVVVAEPGVLDDHFGVRAFLREDHVEVVADVVRQRRARQQFQEIRRLKIQAGVGDDLAADRIDRFAVARLHERHGPGSQRKRLRQRQRFVTGSDGVITPVRHAVVHISGEAVAEVVEARIGSVADVAADAVLAGERRHRAGGLE